MFRIDSHVWNQIAPMAQHPEWRRRMAMDNEALNQEMDRLGQALRAQGAETPVVLGYAEVAPLLQERAAIQTFLAKNPQYRQALPDVKTANEAILVAMKEHNLTASQTRTLRQLLEITPPM